MDHTANQAPSGTWRSRGLIVTVSGPGDSRVSLRVPRPCVRIGSHPRAEVSLPEGNLLPCHLYLHATEQGIYCLGLSDSAPSGWLTPKTRVEIGPYRVKAVFDDMGPPPMPGATELRKKGCPPGPSPHLEISDSNGNSKPVELAVDRQLSVIGRRSPSSVRLGHKTVSRVHCALYWSGEGLWVIDLLGGNGTFLDQDRIDAAAWRPGCELAVGCFRMQYLRLQKPTEAFPASGRSASLAGTARTSEADSDASLIAAHRDVDSRVEDSVADSSLRLPAVTVHRSCKDGDGDSAVDSSTGGPDENKAVRNESSTGATPDSLDVAIGEAASRDEPNAPVLTHFRERRPDEAVDGAGRLSLQAPARQPLKIAQELATATVVDALPAEVSQAFMAIVEQAFARSNSAVGRAADPALLVREAMRRLMHNAELRDPVERLEQELSMVCLTLVKAGQTVEQAGSPEAPDVDRLIAAMRGLERQLARLAPHLNPDLGPVSSEPPTARLPSPPAAVSMQSGASSSSLSAARLPFLPGPKSLAPQAAARGQDFSPTANADRLATSPTPASDTNQAPSSAASDLPTANLDDRMLERLVDFQAKGDAATQRRRLLWSAAAAIAVVLIVALVGAAKLWSDRTSHGEGSREPPSGDYAASLD